MLKNIKNRDDHKDASYDVESLFSSIFIKETIGYIIHKTLHIKTISKTLIIKKLLIKLIRECTFSMNNRLIK